MVILVTGGAGFIGGNYLHFLAKTYPDARIVCLDSLSYSSNVSYIESLFDNSVIFERADIADKLAVDLIFQKYNPDYVIHFAAESHVDNSINDYAPFIRTNIIGSINLFESARQCKNLKKFVHVSTDEVYGSLSLDEPQGFLETDPYETNSPYSASKASSDCFARAFYKTYDVPIVITNCSNNYGPNQHKEKLIPTIINNALNDNQIPVYGNGLNVRDWLFVLDHCRAINLVMENGKLGERYNIGGGVEVNNIDMVNKILDLLGKPKSLITYVADRPGHDLRYSIDCSKIEHELGYKPLYDLESGLLKTLEWYQRDKNL